MPTHTGSCHCGAVRIEVDTELEQTVTCNCSICRRTGSVFTFVSADALRVLSGEDQLVDYQFAKKHTHHPFCRTCGIRTHGWGEAPDGSTMFSVNTRCLDGVDLESLESVQYDGASL